MCGHLAIPRPTAIAAHDLSPSLSSVLHGLAGVASPGYLTSHDNAATKIAVTSAMNRITPQPGTHWPLSPLLIDAPIKKTGAGDADRQSNPAPAEREHFSQKPDDHNRDRPCQQKHRTNRLGPHIEPPRMIASIVAALRETVSRKVPIVCLIS